MMRLDFDDPCGLSLPASGHPRANPLPPPLPAVASPSAPGGLGLSDGGTPCQGGSHTPSPTVNVPPAESTSVCLRAQLAPSPARNSTCEKVESGIPLPPRPAPHLDGEAGNPAGPVLAGEGAPLPPTLGSPSAGNPSSGTGVGGTSDAGSIHQIPGAAKGDVSHG